MNDDTKNIKCLIFRYKDDYSKFKLITFKTRNIAKLYYNVALRKPNFVYAETYNECIKWLHSNNYKFDIIEREYYNIYE